MGVIIGFFLDTSGLNPYISTRLRGVLSKPQQAAFSNPHSAISPEGSLKMAVNITPLHDRVLVRRVEEKESVKGGIIIPDSAKEKPQEGEVIAVGAGKTNEEGKRVALDVKVGDRILFGKYSGNDIKVDDEEYLIMKEHEILAKIGGAAKAAGGKK
jgi:chaperonin GroES